ncbi:MAG TPA: zinc ribbon domain-containing protein [Candidatus Dormibacteraeota bacterium]|nr:zinc ribbon domain-containing protein [Candidatus Dormibacteraeota bacterium]
MQGPAGAEQTSFCRECGKPIEADARFCRFCGKPQAEQSASATPTTSRSQPVRAGRPAAGATDGLERRLRQLFPRHHLQDEFVHVGTIAAFFMAVIGFVLGFFAPALGGNWLSTDFLLGSIALTLFLILRESTLSHIRARGGAEPGHTPAGGRYQAARPASPTADLPAEAATTQSSPAPGSGAGRPAGSGRPPASRQ